jgi:hypothetical protein
MTSPLATGYEEKEEKIGDKRYTTKEKWMGGKDRIHIVKSYYNREGKLVYAKGLYTKKEI